ncbi:MAG: hypothetical protein ACR2NO_09605 [Chloroflexota bacterium]
MSSRESDGKHAFNRYWEKQMADPKFRASYEQEAAKKEPANASLDDVLREATRDGRVCPKPQQWNRLWELLPDRQRQGSGWQPPLPLILAAWWEVTDAEKRERFHLHIRWAYERGALSVVADFIRGLRSEDWHREH